MKIFKGLISLILLLCINSIDAKRTGVPATQPTPPPILQPTSPQKPPQNGQPKPMQPQPITQQVPPQQKQRPQTQAKPTPTPAAPTPTTKQPTIAPSSFTKASDFAKTSTDRSTDKQTRRTRPAQSSFASYSAKATKDTKASADKQPTRQATPTQRQDRHRRGAPTKQQVVPVAVPIPVPSPLPMKPVQPVLAPKPVAQPTPQKPFVQAAPAGNYSITNNVVMALDPRKKETVQTGAESLVQQSLVALYQKVTPVIMTNNILEIILTLRQRIGEQNLRQLRTMGFQQLFNHAQQLANMSGIPGISSISVILLSNIDFDAQNLNCYFHTSENLALLIPKEYIRTNIPKAMNVNLNDQAKACGFNPAVLKAVADPSIANLLRQLQIDNTRFPEKDKFISHLTSMFTVQKKNGQLISPERDSKWIIYIVGHGSPAFMTIGFVREQYNMIKGSVENAQQALARGNPNQRTQAQQYLNQYEPKAKEYEQMLEGRSGWANTQIIPESAQIAGIPGADFTQLMTFFDESLDTAYVHYVTCFSGGSNQTFVNETLSKLNVHFIVSTQGIQEGYTSAQIKVGVQSDKPGIQISGQDFAEFFKLLKMFFTQQQEFVKMKKMEGKGKDPILLIIATLSSDEKAQNQPFVRFPGAGAFVAAPVTDTTKVLTKTMVRAHEIEKKPIDLSDPDINVAIINTPRINVMLDLGKKGAQGHTALVTPSPASFQAGYESIHLFKEINWQDTLQSLLFNLSYLNARQFTQTFVINSVRGILLQQSGLQGAQGALITNLIVQMKSVSGVNRNPGRSPLQLTPVAGQALVGSNVGLNINVAFELNDNIYQTFFAIQDFENPDQLYQDMQRLGFVTTPKRSMNMNNLANVFLTQQEIARVPKPITLSSIAEFIDDKIDKQDPSMAIISDADDKALLDFVSRKARRRRK